MNELIKISSNENDEQEVTVKSSLIEANELIKAAFSDYGIQNEDGEQITRKEFADLVGQKIWLAADILGIELDQEKTMNQLITITQNENNDQVVSGRELHEFLEVKTPYHIWFERMAEYGFTENVDFIGFEQKSSKLGGRPSVDHALKIDMAKEISMIQRNEKGKQARQYFIEVEKELKQQLLPQTPEQQIALLAQGNVNLNKKVEQIENSVLDLTDRFGLPSNKAKVLQKKVASKVYMFTGGKYSNAHKKLGAKVFREFYKDLNNRFDVVKYSDIPLSRYDEATEYLDMWQPSFNTTLEIRGLNSQTSFDFEAQKGVQMEYKDDDYLTTQQVAEKFSIHDQTVYRRRKAMELFPQFKSGIFMNGRRFRYKEIRDFMQFVNTPEYKQELKKRQSVIK